MEGGNRRIAANTQASKSAVHSSKRRGLASNRRKARTDKGGPPPHSYTRACTTQTDI